MKFQLNNEISVDYYHFFERTWIKVQNLIFLKSSFYSKASDYNYIKKYVINFIYLQNI